MTTYGDWFTGFGGMTLGAMAAGLDVVFGAEYDAKIADVYRLNIGDHVKVCDLLKNNVADFPRVDVFHASPPCPNFSNAKANGEENENDIALSAKVAEYIVYHLPDIFTLENVYQYRNSKSWLTIARALHNHGYLFNYWHVNMADYGVPQTRQRMIVIARRDGIMPQLPPATHTAEPVTGLFGTMARWVSWYEAIEDLIPDLPNSEFAPWQVERLPDEYRGMTKPFFWQGANTQSNGKITNEQHEPARTVDTSAIPKAFIVSEIASGIKDCNMPYSTVLTRAKGGAMDRGFMNGRVIQMTPRTLARFQSFPDRYELPESKKIACRGIGNAVPPLFAEKLYRHLVPGARL